MMGAVEFTGKIEGGTIKLPDELGTYDNAQARVILLLDEPVDLSAKKERLRRVFARRLSTGFTTAARTA